MKEIIFHVNAKDSPSDGRNRVEMEYKVFVPAQGGYRGYGSHSFHRFFWATTATITGTTLNLDSEVRFTPTPPHRVIL